VQARAAWNPAKQPSWLTEKVFSEKIQPALEQASATASAKRIGVSRWYAGRIREGYTCLFGSKSGFSNNVDLPTSQHILLTL
jgi:hypothetical protein